MQTYKGYVGISTKAADFTPFFIHRITQYPIPQNGNIRPQTSDGHYH